MASFAIRNCTLVTPGPTDSAVCGKAMGQLLISQGACIVVRDGVIDKVVTDCDFSTIVVDEWYDAEGHVVMPGIVDSHTHLIFGGHRPDEFKMRLEGATYMEIMNAGGGIQSTVDATRHASEEELRRNAIELIDRMVHMGVTTVEAKSGYGLDEATEEKMLRVIESLRRDPATPIDLVATFLGAHAVPREYQGRTSDYIDLMVNEMLPRFRSLARHCDVFCERGVFEIEDSRRLLAAARALGYSLKLHADEIVQLGGGELAAELGAVSADHLLHVSDEGIDAMVKAGVVATLLPLTAFALKEPFAPARKFIDRGGAVALATDLNPGSCYSGSIPLTIALACIYMNMTIEETITALTINGAAALGMADVTGTIEPGKRADLVVLATDNINMLPYYVGMNLVSRVYSRGRLVAVNDYSTL